MRRTLVPMLGVTAMLALGTPVGAVTFTLDSTVDAVDVAPGDGTCASASSGCTLRAAIQETNALPSSDRVVIPAGTYVLTIPGTFEDAAATGDLDIRDDLEIAGAGADDTILDGNGIDRVLEQPMALLLLGPNIVISGVTIQHGSMPIGAGGGMDSGGSVHFRDCVIRDNDASTGGGLYVQGALTLERCVVSGNSSTAGGGIQAWNETTIVDSVISDNHALGSLGGGIFAPAVDGAELHLLGSTVSGNSAVQRGGGIYFASEGATLENTTVSGNVAGSDGGGVFRAASYMEDDELEPVGPLVLLNATITGNRAGTGNGGGIAFETSVLTSPVPEMTIRNSILAGNVDDGGEAPECFPSVTAEGRNLVQAVGGCALHGTVAGITVGVDPLLGPLQDNGGTTPTHALSAGSAAVDAGDPTIPGSGGAACTIRDQRGVIRPQGNACDLGAYEIGVPLCAAPAPGCTAAADGRAKLQLKQDGHATLQWKWRGAIADATLFGNPLGGASYVLCIFDAVTGAPIAAQTAVVAGGPCPDRPCWRQGKTGFAYKNRVGSPSGISTLRLVSAKGAGTIMLKGGGPLLELPSLPLSQDPAVLVQLQRSDGGACWESTLPTFKRNDVHQFLAP